MLDVVAKGLCGSHVIALAADGLAAGAVREKIEVVDRLRHDRRGDESETRINASRIDVLSLGGHPK